jgi:hypothetical protein
MPAMAQHLSSTPEEHTVTLNLCQCTGCGLVQLDNAPVWYWNRPVRIYNGEMNERIDNLKRYGVDFISCNEMEHKPNPNKFLEQFTGKGIIEVPNFYMILQKNLFAEIMLDHLMYFTKDTLRFALQYNGFDVIGIDSVWDDFILSATVEKRRSLHLSSFLSQQEILKLKLDDYISHFDRVAIYGASHEAFAYIAMLNPRVAFVVDDSPMKQGKYTPVGGLPIYPPIVLTHRLPIAKPITFYSYQEKPDTYNLNGGVEIIDPPDAVIIMGAGYSDEILKNLDFDGSVAVMRNWGVEIIK